jgi:hypothetical protein
MAMCKRLLRELPHPVAKGVMKTWRIKLGTTIFDTAELAQVELDKYIPQN